jgi:hypothetical protein
LRCAIDDLLDGAHCIEQFFLFDLFAGVGGVLEFGTASPQGRKRREGWAELSTDRLFDGEVATFLGSPKALLRKHSDEGETRCVVGSYVRRFRVGVSDEPGRLVPPSRFGDPTIAGGLASGDSLQFAEPSAAVRWRERRWLPRFMMTLTSTSLSERTLSAGRNAHSSRPWAKRPTASESLRRVR